jgi:hypothetical protein
MAESMDLVNSFKRRRSPRPLPQEKRENGERGSLPQGSGGKTSLIPERNWVPDLQPAGQSAGGYLNCVNRFKKQRAHAPGAHILRRIQNFQIAADKNRVYRHTHKKSMYLRAGFKDYTLTRAQLFFAQKSPDAAQYAVLHYQFISYDRAVGGFNQLHG